MNKGSAEALRKSYLVGLTPAMRTALLDEATTLNTARALHRRGMVLSWYFSNRDSCYPSCYPLNLTDLGKWAAEAIRAEMDATPIIPTNRVAEIEMVTISVPKHLADAVTEAWSAAYDQPANTPIRQAREAGLFEALHKAYLTLREAVDGYQYPWLSRALLDAAQDAQRLQDGV